MVSLTCYIYFLKRQRHGTHMIMFCPQESHRAAVHRAANLMASYPDALPSSRPAILVSWSLNVAVAHQKSVSLRLCLNITGLYCDRNSTPSYFIMMMPPYARILTRMYLIAVIIQHGSISS